MWRLFKNVLDFIVLIFIFGAIYGIYYIDYQHKLGPTIKKISSVNSDQYYEIEDKDFKCLLEVKKNPDLKATSMNCKAK